jgi:ribosomal protein S18 acetylase RimI-like enzyme
MQATSIEVVACPKQAVKACLELLMRELPDAQRQERIAADLSATPAGLFAAIDGQTVVGAIWAQPFAGRTAFFWSPQLHQGTPARVADTLTATATSYLQDSGCQFAQAVVPTQSAPEAQAYQRHGFVFVANLLYLTAQTQVVRPEIGKPKTLTFEPYHPTQLDRLVDIIQQTYLGTLDCPRLNSARDLHDVISGYRATGFHDPKVWFFVRDRDRDVGVVLLARHLQLCHSELMYMGLIPAARGQGHAQRIVRHALATATEVGDQQLVLAVDRENLPAIATYDHAGFTEWDRRTVLAWFPRGDFDKRLNFTEDRKSRSCSNFQLFA